MKKIVYVDMDDTLADFYKAAKTAYDDGSIDEGKMYLPQFFFKLDVIPGAQYAIHHLERMGFDVRILTQPLVTSVESYSDKVKWIAVHFPSLINKIVMTQDKGVIKGDYLIDDALKWRAPFEKNGGKFIHFPYGARNQLPQTPEFLLQMWTHIVDTFETYELVDK